MSVLRWGIISAGKAAHDFVAALSGPNNGHKVTAVAARDVNKAREFAEKFEIPIVYDTYDDLISSHEIDVVYVGVINPYHFEITKRALEKRKPVLCEKPMAMNLNEVFKLVQLAEKKQVFLMEGIWSRFFPVYDCLRKHLRENTIGQIKHLNVTLGHKISHIPRLREKELGGGSILDLGVYVLQFVILVFGRKFPEIIKAFGTLNEQGIEEYVTCIFKYDGDKYAHLTLSTTFCMENSAQIYGTDGMITVCNPFNRPTKIMINDEVNEFELPPNDHEFFISHSSGLLYEADHVKMCLKKGYLESPLVTHADSLAIAKLQDILRREIGAYVP